MSERICPGCDEPITGKGVEVQLATGELVVMCRECGDES